MTSNLTPELEPSDVTPTLHASANGLPLPVAEPAAGSAIPAVHAGALEQVAPGASIAEPLPVETDGVVGTTGSTALLADQLRADFGVDGTGIKVGVLSDSFNVLGGAATDEADGDLPASGVTVLAEGHPGDTDEGRAMLELVHQIAPGAQLFFATTGTNEATTAANIQALRNAGCNIILDDVSFFDEPFFQPDIISQAIDNVVASGAMYFTVAGNDAGNAYQSAWRGTAGDTEFNFNSGAGPAVPTQAVSVEIFSGASIVFDLQWAQPFNSPSSELELVVSDNAGDTFTGTGGVNANGIAEAVVALTNTSAQTIATTLNVSIDRLTGPDPSLIKYIASGDGQPVTISGANSGTVFGHHEDPNAITVAAAPAPTPTVAEPFTSSGAGSELLFNINGSPIDQPVNEVDLTGVDGINTSLPGGLGSFFGTSASVATVAGAAALLEQVAPGDSNAQIEQALENTAENIGAHTLTGFGLVQALAAADAIAAPHVFQANNAADVIFLGSGTNTVIGGAGNDTIFITQDSNNTIISGSGNDTLDCAAATSPVIVDLTTSVASNGFDGTDTFIDGTMSIVTVIAENNDTLIGGTGRDVLEALGTGNLLMGSSGTEVLLALNNADTLIGGSGNDALLIGGSDNVAEGGGGSDGFGATGSHNTLIAGSGNTAMTVSGNANTLEGGVGTDKLVVASGSGNLLQAGSGNGTLQASGGGNTLMGGDGTDLLIAFNNANVLFAESGTVALEVAGSGDELLGGTGADAFGASGNGNALFAGTAAAMMTVLGSGNELFGGTGTDVMFVSGGSGNRVQGGSGTDTLQAIGGGNTLIGGRGTELLIAFNNSNVLFAGSGNASLEVGGNGNVLLGGTGADAFGASGNGNALQAGTAAAQMTVTGNGNVLLGGSGADRLVVTSGSGDKLVAGSGTDTLADGGTQGFYDFGRGDGQAAIVNGAAGAVAPSNELDFGANITDQNLWFVQSGNNLQIDLMGTTSAATVDGWFSGAGHQLQEITAGGLKLDSQVAQLVQAMATFQNNHPAFNPTGAAAAPNDPTLQATIAAAWHH